MQGGTFRFWKTNASVELAALEYVSWFIHHRLFEFIGYITPAEADAVYKEAKYLEIVR